MVLRKGGPIGRGYYWSFYGTSNLAVRKGAVYSLGKLAAHRPFFASTALEHLTDMFNDEIADVCVLLFLDKIFVGTIRRYSRLNTSCCPRATTQGAAGCNVEMPRRNLKFYKHFYNF